MDQKTGAFAGRIEASESDDKNRLLQEVQNIDSSAFVQGRLKMMDIILTGYETWWF